jgi:hypothetical protein
MKAPTSGVATTAAGEAYVSGALTAARDGAPVRLFYELVGEIVRAAGLRPYLPHRVSDPVAAPDLDPRTVYDIDRAHVSRARLVIAYAGVPSFGVGIEVELAREHGVPVIVIAERDRAVSRMLLGSPAVVDVVRFADLDSLRAALTASIERVAALPHGVAHAVASDDVVVLRFLASLGEARRLPEAEVAALLRVAELDGEPANAIRAAIAQGRLFGVGLRDLVGRHALRGADLGMFILRDVLERSLAQCAQAFGMDRRAARRHLDSARSRVGLSVDADPPTIGQWLVTELIAPPTRALQLHLFARTSTEESS